MTRQNLFFWASASLFFVDVILVGTGTGAPLVLPIAFFGALLNSAGHIA